MPKSKKTSRRPTRQNARGYANEVRIISGKWRGRKIRFPAAPELRPTPDRLRETLFNWLIRDIDGVSCLDLFAGSGILGLEALSRGAGAVTFVESNVLLSTGIQRNLQELQTNSGKIIVEDAIAHLAENRLPFRVVFIDPPYHGALAEKALALILDKRSVYRHSLIYLETAGNTESIVDGAQWMVLKQSKAGNASGQLLKMRPHQGAAA